MSTSTTGVQWTIRLEGGAVHGPIETGAIVKMIRDGSFSGTEMISRYPDGNWTYISREPEFYDILMEALEGAIKSENRATKKSMTEETQFMPPPPSAETPEARLKAALEQQPIVKKPTASASTKDFAPPPPLNTVVDLKKVYQEETSFISSVRGPLILVSLAVVLFFVFVMMSGKETNSDKISLLGPGKAKAPLAEAEIKKRYQIVLAHVEKDTFEDYLEAQNKLVSLIEGAPSSLEMRSVLCLVYKELWPFAKQDAGDVKTVASFVQGTRSLDITSPYGSFCEVIRLQTAGRQREARASVESLLENFDSFSMRPVVYSIKAELLENEKDFQIAARYYEKSAQDWEKWLRPRVRLGYVQLQLHDYPAAAVWFRNILAQSPNHKQSKIGLGFTEYLGAHQNESALKLLSGALSSSARIPRSLESDAWQTQGEIQVTLGQKGEALKSAQTAYKLNPNNENARGLVLRLGGSDKLGKGESQNNEMIYLGDQYVRQGDCLSAQAEFKAAFDLDPKNAMAAMKAAKCLWQLNQSYEAIEWLNKSIRADPKFVSAYVQQADYLSQRYDFNAAGMTLANVSRIASGNAEVLRGMALLELRKNNMMGAINYAMRAAKIYDADIDTNIILSKANLGLAQGIHSSAKKDVERKEAAFKDAIRYANKATEIDPASTEAQIAYARMLAATNGVDSGADYLASLIKKYNYSFEYRLALAEVARESERWNDARLIYEQVVELDPRNKKAWIGLGESFRATGFNEKALKAFLNAAVIDPTDGEALFQAGKLYFETNRFDESLQQFLRVKAMNPNFPKSNYYAGKAAFALGRFDDAAKYVLEEKRQNPSLAESFILNAEIHAARGAYGDCAAEYAQALKLRSSGAEIYVKSAECYRKAGSIEIAETMLTLAKEKESGYADLYRELGALFEKKGDNSAARQSYRNYLELAPNATDRKDIEQRIARLSN